MGVLSGTDGVGTGGGVAGAGGCAGTDRGVRGGVTGGGGGRTVTGVGWADTVIQLTRFKNRSEVESAQTDSNG